MSLGRQAGQQQGAARLLEILFSIPEPGGSDDKESACKTRDWFRSLGWGDPLEKGMATHSSTLAWRIP